MRLIWLITLCAFLSGCAGWQPASLPGAEGEQGTDESEVVVHRRSKVRVTTHVGAVIEGEVTEIGENQLTILKEGNHGRDERVVNFEEIDLVEVEKGSTTLVVAFVSAIVVGGAVIFLVHEGIKSGTEGQN